MLEEKYTFNIICNYCGQQYIFKTSYGDDNYTNYLKTKHSHEFGLVKSQTQLYINLILYFFTENKKIKKNLLN